MRLFRKSSSSPYPSSPSSHPVTGNDSDSANYRGRSFTQRQRKLRHVTERELGLQPGHRSCSLPTSPDSNRKQRLLGESDHWSLLAVPQPLPLPDSPQIRRPDLNLGPGRTRSPEAGPSSAQGRNDAYHVVTTPRKSPCNFCGKVSEDVNNEGANYDLRPTFPAKTGQATALSSPAVSPQISGEARLSFMGRNLAKPSVTYPRRFSQDDLVVNYNLKSNVSAPTSGLSSPIGSPQRSNSFDFLPSYLAPQGSQVRPASEVPKYGRLGSHTSPVSPVKIMQCPDRSPLSSPKGQSPRLFLNGPSEFISPFHGNLLPGSSKEFASISPNLAKPSGTYRRRFSQDLDDLVVNYNLKSNVFSGSAPTSGLSSPIVSPQRSNSIDFLPSYLAPQGSQVRSPSEIPKYGRLSNHTSPVSPVKTMQSPDRSPLPSPKVQSPCLILSSPSQFNFPFHHDLLPGSSKVQSESNNYVNAHPLPLPPGAVAASQSVTPLPPAVTLTQNTAEQANLASSKVQWKKGKLIGRGTFGSVYVAINRETGASCAMKEVDIIPDDPKSAECIKQLEQEIRILSHLKHPNIVQYYGSEIVDDHFYIYLEYIHPGSINKYFREHCGDITESIVRNFTRHILSGLAYLHSSKTIHRDIKCANLLVDTSGTVKLADFGMAKHLTGLSYELSLKGSPYWMAPEVLKAVMLSDASPDLAFAVDIWSLGCTVIEMFTGKPPWSELEGPQAMFKVLNKTPPIPETLSSDGKDFLNWCFRRNPAERPSAIKLLEHTFVQNSKDRNASFCSDTCQQGFAMPLNCATTSHSSSCSAPENSHFLSMLQVHGSHHFNPYSNVSSIIPLAAGNNHPCPLSLMKFHI